jgi:hypothetical protein
MSFMKTVSEQASVSPEVFARGILLATKNNHRFSHHSIFVKIQPDATVCRYLFTAKSLYI